MLNIPKLTDSSTSDSLMKSRSGHAVAFNDNWERVKDNKPAVHLLRRIRARQWGNATTAQAVLFVAAACDAKELPKLPQGNPDALLLGPWDDEEKAQSNQHFTNKAGTKEHNAAIRVLKHEKPAKLLAVMAWLIDPERTQTEIQAVLRPLVEARFGYSTDRSTLLIKQRDWNGLRGYLHAPEVFPHVPPPKQKYEPTLLDWFAE